MKYKEGQKIGKYKILSVEELPEQNATGYRLPEKLEIMSIALVIFCEIIYSSSSSNAA